MGTPPIHSSYSGKQYFVDILHSTEVQVNNALLVLYRGSPIKQQLQEDLPTTNALYSGKQSTKISNDQELIQSDPTSCPQNQKGNN